VIPTPGPWFTAITLVVETEPQSRSVLVYLTVVELKFADGTLAIPLGNINIETPAILSHTPSVDVSPFANVSYNWKSGVGKQTKLGATIVPVGNGALILITLVTVAGKPQPLVTLYVNVSSPAETPLIVVGTTPVPVMVARGLENDHVAMIPAPAVAGVGVDVCCKEDKIHNESSPAGLPPVVVIGFGLGLTLIVTVVEALSLLHKPVTTYLITACAEGFTPGATDPRLPSTIPVTGSTPATAGLLDVHVPPVLPVAVNGVELPEHNGELPETDITSTLGLTKTVLVCAIGAPQPLLTV